MEAENESLIDKLRRKTTVELLHMRAEGDMLADEWHALIETVLRERGENVPPFPTAPIVIEKMRQPMKGDAFLCGMLVVASMGLSRMTAHSAYGLVASLLFVGYFLIKHMRNAALPPKQYAEEQAANEANALGLDELMKCAADGNSARVKELLAFHAFDINARSANGSTALFYAARNGHEEIVALLLGAGADPTIKNDKGSTASDIAVRYGHANLQSTLRQG